MASILKVDTIQDQSGNNIINENADTITIGASGDTIAIPTGATLTVPSGKLTGQNYPAFFAKVSGTQSVTNNVATKAECDTEVLDTDGYYDNATNYRFTPLVAGKYYVYGFVVGDGSNSTLVATQSYIYKNGSAYIQNYAIPSNNYGATDGPFVACIVDMNGTTDYIELYGRTNVNSGSAQFFGGDLYTSFGAYRIGD